MHTRVCVCVCIYIYIYTHTHNLSSSSPDDPIGETQVASFWFLFGSLNRLSVRIEHFLIFTVF